MCMCCACCGANVPDIHSTHSVLGQATFSYQVSPVIPRISVVFQTTPKAWLKALILKKSDICPMQ